MEMAKKKAKHTNPIGSGTEQVTLNCPEGMKEAFMEIALECGLGTSANRIMSEILQEALETGFARELVQVRMEKALTGLSALEKPILRPGAKKALSRAKAALNQTRRRPAKA